MKVTIAIATAFAVLCFLATTATAKHHHHHDSRDVWHNAENAWDNGESTDSLFSKCVCWNTTNNSWCGGDQFWDRKPCKQWSWRAALWGVPAIMIMVCYIFFPFFFFVFRCICNCCGGRNPSYGCCCPHDNTCCCPKLTNGRVEERTYSNRAIFLTKFFFCVAFGVQIYYAVGSFVTNHHVHESTMDVIHSVGDATANLGATMDITGNNFATLKLRNATFVPGDSMDQVLHASSVYKDRIVQIDNALSTIKNIENNPSWGRKADMYRIPSFPLFLALIVAFMCLFNLRGFHLTIIGSIMSWTAALVTFAFLMHMIFAQVSTEGCNTYNTTVVPTIVGAVESNHGCNSGRTLSPINKTVAGFQRAVCDGITVHDAQYAGLTSLCDDYFNCPKTDLAALCAPINANVTYKTGRLPNITALIAAAATITSGAKPKAAHGGNVTCDFPANYSGDKTCTIENCAKYCSKNSNSFDQSNHFVNFVKTYRSPVEYLSNVAFPQFFNCTALRKKLYGDVHHTLCGSFDKNYTSIAVTLLAQMINCIPLIVITIVGAKRFRKMDRSEREKESIVYGLLLTDEEAQKYAGSPIGSPTSASYGATATDSCHAAPVPGQDVQGGYYATAPTTDDAESMASYKQVEN